MTHEVSHGPVNVREAGAEDAEFLLDVLMAEANRDTDQPLSRRQLLRDRTLSHYVAGWGREDDIGLIAVDTAGPNGLQIPVGAAWLRFFSPKLPGRAFIDETVPELTVGVTSPHKNRGIELALIRELTQRARAQGVRRISVTSGTSHPCREIFELAGFVHARHADEGEILVLDI